MATKILPQLHCHLLVPKFALHIWAIQRENSKATGAYERVELRVVKREFKQTLLATSGNHQPKGPHPSHQVHDTTEG